jgi:predicted ATPase
VAGDFPDGVYFVPLVALRESELVLPAIATTYGIQEGEDLRGRLIGAIGSKRQLIVLDKFEQLLSAGSEIGGLLGETPRLKLLVTSRSLLGVYGEREYDVPTLSLPDPDRLPRVDELARSEAVALFVDEVRVDMLETLREFALERLRARGELDEYQERHAMSATRWPTPNGPNRRCSTSAARRAAAGWIGWSASTTTCERP